MANNRLYLVDTEANEGIMVAKGFSDWSWRKTDVQIAKFLDGRDLASAYRSDVPSKLQLYTEHDLPQDVVILSD